MFAYCGNNPIVRVDVGGFFWDYIVDTFFIGLSVADVVEDPSDWENWAVLGVDVLFAVVPFVPSGAGQVIKAGEKISDGAKLAKKITVVGESMSRVENYAKSIGALDNVYGGFTYYKSLAAQGKVGKFFAEIIGKASNFAWLYGKLRNGYTIVDIGLDMKKVMRSSSYALEQITLEVWKCRNLLKGIIHFGLGEQQ